MTAVIDYNLARLVADNVYGRPSGGLHGIIPSGWTLDTDFNRDGLQSSNPGELRLPNGFYAYALKSTDPNDDRRILAFRGTENARDWLANISDIGESQFTQDAKDIVNPWLAQQLVDGNKVELVGHSLGGALVQWTVNNTNREQINVFAQGLTGNEAYQVDPSLMHFTTFNAPGIRFSPGGLLASNTTTGVDGEHHVIAIDFALPTPGLQGDFVHLLGGRPVGGIIVAHRVDFTQFAADGNIYDAHLISKPWWNAPVDPGHTPPFAIDFQKAQVVGRFVADMLGPRGQLNNGAIDALKIGLVLGAGLTAGTALQFGIQLSQLVQGVGADLQTLATRLLAPGTDGLQDGFAYLLDLANTTGQNVATFTLNLSAAAITTWQAIAGLGSAVVTLGIEQLGSLIADVAQSIGNAVLDRLHDVPNTLFNLGRTLSFVELNPFTMAYAQALEDPRLGSALRTAIEDAQQIVQQAGQTVVVQKGMGPNPFETTGFNPDTAPPATVTANEGQLNMFTIHLPFEAGVGGQKLTLTLSGPNASGVVLRTNGIELFPNGSTFTLTIPEGQQQLVVGLQHKQDIGASSSLTVSVQLVDANGIATHAPDQEATITVTDTGPLRDGTVPTIDYNNGYSTETVSLTAGPPEFNGSGGSGAFTQEGPINSVVQGNYGPEIIWADNPQAITFFAQNQQVFGGDGSDKIIGDFNDQLYGEDGDDVILAGWGSDVVDGGAGRDAIFADMDAFIRPSPGTFDDYLDGGSDEDSLSGMAGNDTLLGGTGNDELFGDDHGVYTERPVGNDYLDGGDGHDRLYAGLGDDTLIGGIGNDRLFGDNRPAGEDSYLWTERPWINEEWFQGFEFGIIGGVGIPIFSVTGGRDYLEGGAGDDFLQGDGGDDVLLGGADNDELWGDDQQVGVIQEGDDWLEGGAGNDQLVGGGGKDALFGGEDDDLLVGDYANNPTLGFDDTLDGGAGADELHGGGGNDLLDGGSDNDRLFGQEGDDQLYGGIGDDQLQGGNGDDVLVGEEGIDRLFGEAGNDVLFGEDGDDQLSGGGGLDQLVGGLGNDVLLGDGENDILFGEEGNDQLQGGDGHDTLLGEVGTDVLFGDAGDDTLWGDDGDDQLSGDAGNDVLIGGTGNDLLLGGVGRDSYHIGVGEGADVITDNAGEGNRVVFNDGIMPDDVGIGLAPTAMVIQIGSGGGQVAITGFSANDALAPSGITDYQFADGTIVTHADLVARGLGIDPAILASAAVTGRVMAGGTGGDPLNGTSLNDLLHGGAGNDSLSGNAGADTLIGGTGDDQLHGGSGNDTYVYRVGDGLDVVVDTAVAGEGNVVSFGQGIASADVRLMVNGSSVVVGTGDPMQGVLLGNTRRSSITGTHDIERFQTTDGTVLSYADLLARGIDVAGTAGDDRLFGTSIGDWFVGKGGNDHLFGGAGHDQYRFNLGDGIDTIVDTASMAEGNEVTFGAGITSSMLTLSTVQDSINSSSGHDLVLRIGESGDQLWLTGFDRDNVLGPHAVETFRFTDGTSFAYAQLLERGIQISGTSGAETLIGTNGNDRFVGGAGNDRMEGKGGDDRYVFGRGAGQDTIVDRTGALDTIECAADLLPSEMTITRSGRDLVLAITGTTDQVTVSEFFVADTFRIEAVRFADGTVWDAAFLAEAVQHRVTGTESADVLDGTDADDLLMGFAGDDRLTGLAGDDHLDGGTGIDRMAGGLGDDVYVVDAIGDEVTENLNEGIDAVQSSVTHTIGENVEHLTLTGLGAINGTGNAQDNILVGNGAANVLAGGAGHDTYVISTGDTVVEQANDGLDSVQSDQSHALGAHVENLTLTGTAAIKGTGNALDNVLTGNGAMNLLAGGAGNDTYVLKGLEIVTESAGQGIDTVMTAQSYQLASHVEHLTLLDSDRSLIGNQLLPVSIDAMGNELDNTLTGNRAVNRLDGGVGADVMRGKAGNDTYVVDDAGDVVIETAVDGLDQVESAIGYTLTDHVEDLLLTGMGATSGTGNQLDNRIVGNSAGNVLDGAGGNDRLEGGAGGDTYLFGHGSGWDRVVDSGIGDVIQLKAGITPNDLAAAQYFHAGIFQPNGLVLGILGSTDALYIQSYFHTSAPPLIRFDDGTTWDLAAVNQRMVTGPSFVGPDWRNLATVRESVTTILGTAGNDLLSGTAGPDLFFSSSGSDTLVGGAGDDRYSIDFAGDDVIIEDPHGGMDTVTGDMPEGYVLPDNVENAEFFGRVMTGNALDNVITAGPVSNTLDGGEGNDVLIGGFLRSTPVSRDDSGSDLLIGGAGDDTLIPVGGVYHSSGLIAPITNAAIIKADDVLVGGRGDDTYVVYHADAMVVERVGEGTDWVRSAVTYTLPGNVENLELVDSGIPGVPNGTGNELENLIRGNSLANVLQGEAGNDTLHGGLDDDVVQGGIGHDTYLFNLGDGRDTIEDIATGEEGNRIQFGKGITQSDLAFTQDEVARTLTIHVGSSGTDQLVLTNFDPTGLNGSVVVETLAFADGSVTGLAQLLGLGGPVNHAPTVGNPIADQAVSENAPLSLVVLADTFTDQDTGDTLTYNASLADGSALPSWVSFNPTTRTFTGTPDDDGVGSLDLKVTATDTGNLTASDVFTLTVTNMNEAPVVATPAADHTTLEDVPFTFVIPANTFLDQDVIHGDTLTYGATLANGDPLPAWLSFDSITGTLSGTPLNDDAGNLNVAVKATDEGGLSTTSTFTLTIQNVNDAPTVANGLADQNAAEDSAFSLIVPGTTFTDVDAIHGDVLTYGGTRADGSPLPTWLSFDATTRTFSGTPGVGDAGVMQLAVTATDNQLARVTEEFTLTVAGPRPKTVVGTTGNDALNGGRGNDILAGGAGNDTLLGGSGDDTYIFNLGDGVDTINDTSLPGEGNTIQFGTGITSNDLRLAVGSLLLRVGTEGDMIHLTTFSPDDVLGPRAIETFRFVDGSTLNYSQLVARGFDLTGTAANDSIIGTNVVDRISGLAGNDTLAGGDGNDLLDGGTGTDTMQGGAGDDTYVIDSPGDLVIETAGEGRDTVQSAVTYALGAHVENLMLTGTAAISGTGNVLDNVLLGNSANNTLNGGAGHDRLDGGYGSDVMIGGIGDDTYVVNRAGDIVTEQAGQGNDTVESSITYTLGANVEHLTLTGSAHINGTGNTANNVLMGNSGDNILNAGAGDDTLNAGRGHDILFGGSGRDMLNGGDGNDRLDGGTGDDQLVGGAGNDQLLGGGGADQFTGGRGHDILIGNSGNDTYHFSRGDGQDTILDVDSLLPNQDRVMFGTTINPLDLVISRQADDLRLAIHGSADQVMVKDWYLGRSHRVETMQAGNGEVLLSTQVDQLIQSMAAFTQQTGLTWDQAIDQRPQEVQAVLAASWQ
ncbi:MAG: hypothetical protein A4E19_02250 [Nitrospira sp. SG-bin1]|nr:MAG: hypothetical protein A4E19_02250 [Nitrospira sp. SG-bin1]